MNTNTESAPPPHDPLQFLLIEDNQGDARYLEELLREATTFEAGRGERQQLLEATPELIHAATLEEGLAAVTDETAAVLLDLDLPDSRGVETLGRVSERTEVPIVVLSGDQDRALGMKAIRMGADDYLVKDEINSDLLIRSVYHAIERRQHERELRRYESLIERSADVNAIIDPDGTIQYVTPSVETVLGYDQDTLVGQNAFEFLHPDDRSEVRSALRNVVAAADLPPKEFRIEDASGSWVVLESRARNLLDDPLIGGIVIYTRDVTDRVAREQKLEQFSRVVSHDLRNPLAIAQMYISAYRRGEDPGDLERVEHALERMDNLIDRLLTLAREGKAIEERQQVSVEDVIETAWSHVDAGDASIQFNGELGTVDADPERLLTVFENLFRNACEHGGSDVEIRVNRLENGVAIEDTGFGIPDDVRNEVFEFGFTTGDGTGTGLAIVQEVIDAHGWDIHVTDAADGGARFEIRGISSIRS